MRTKRSRIIVSIVCGLTAAALMAFYASAVNRSASQYRAQALEGYGGEQIEVFVAVRNIAAGEQLTPANVVKRIWLVDMLPAGAATNEADVYGQTLSLPLLANEPVVLAKLGSNTERLSVPEGFCAVTIPTNDVLAVGGAITSGSVVAIYAADKDTVYLLAAEILVLETSNSTNFNTDTGNLFGSGRSRPALSWVTLSVREDMVEEIIVASRTMSLYIVLPGGEF
ncbi:MAG: Flp pilus assembly protein CpaB [Coriobacteriia bacterium]|nr:Flp pilus assembly protein CpaB [Coriobacteriia bacterium]